MNEPALTVLLAARNCERGERVPTIDNLKNAEMRVTSKLQFRIKKILRGGRDLSLVNNFKMLNSLSTARCKSCRGEGAGKSAHRDSF